MQDPNIGPDSGNGNWWTLPERFSDIPYKQKLTIIRSMISDPSDPSDYPIYDPERDTFHKLQGQELITYKVDLLDDMVVVKRNTATFLDGDVDWNVLKLPEGEYDLKASEGSLEGFKQNLGVGLGGKVLDVEESNLIVFSEGDALESNLGVEVLTGEIGIKALSKPKIAAKLLEMGGSTTYVTEPRIDFEEGGKISQTAFRIGGKAGVGMEAEVDEDVFSEGAGFFNSLKKLKPSVGFSPDFDVSNQDLNDHSELFITAEEKGEWYDESLRSIYSGIWKVYRVGNEPFPIFYKDHFSSYEEFQEDFLKQRGLSREALGLYEEDINSMPDEEGYQLKVEQEVDGVGFSTGLGFEKEGVADKAEWEALDDTAKISTLDFPETTSKPTTEQEITAEEIAELEAAAEELEYSVQLLIDKLNNFRISIQNI
jgi:hypothetical protein